MKNYLIFACIYGSVSGGPYLPLLPKDFLHSEGPYVQHGATASNPAGMPLGKAHAHNDYEHESPLLDALSLGFNYIEVDVHLIDGELYVSHFYPLFKDETRTLRKLYLAPLQEIIRKNGGQVFRQSTEPLHLMIDIKTEAEATYQEIKRQLEPFRQWVTSHDNGLKNQKAVNVFLSGNRPVATVAAETSRLASLDGRISDLGKGYSEDLMPVVSERFSSFFGWQLPLFSPSESQWHAFRKATRLAREEGKIFRLWGSPDDEEVWEKLLQHGAGLINTDDLEGLHRFITRKNSFNIATGFDNTASR